MTADIINIEDRDDALHAMLERVLLLVPEKDNQDLNLQRIIAFRLKLDGEAETRDLNNSRTLRARAFSFFDSCLISGMGSTEAVKYGSSLMNSVILTRQTASIMMRIASSGILIIFTI